MYAYTATRTVRCWCCTMTTRATLSSPQAKRSEYEARLRAKAEKLAAASIDPVGYGVLNTLLAWSAGCRCRTLRGVAYNAAMAASQASGLTNLLALGGLQNTKKGKSPEAFMLKANLMVLNGSKLADFDPKSLEKIPLPDMNRKSS